MNESYLEKVAPEIELEDSILKDFGLNVRSNAYSDPRIGPYMGAAYESDDRLEEQLERGRIVAGHSVTLGSQVVFIPRTIRFSSRLS